MKYEDYLEMLSNERKNHVNIIRAIVQRSSYDTDLSVNQWANLQRKAERIIFEKENDE